MLQVCGDLSCGIVCVIENTLIGVRNWLRVPHHLSSVCLSLGSLSVSMAVFSVCPVAPFFPSFSVPLSVSRVSAVRCSPCSWVLCHFVPFRAAALQ